MRSYSSLLVFETVFDSVSSSDLALASLVRYVFQPSFTVLEEDCHTRLGETIDVNFEAEGKIELATDTPLSRDRITTLLSQGVYKVQVRSLSTCITPYGVCASCCKASRPLLPRPAVEDVVQIEPLYERDTEVLYTSGPTTTFTLSVDSESYTTLLIYKNGVLQDPSTYTVNGYSLQMSTTVPKDSYLVVRYVTNTRVPFLLWLANTYCGSLLGVKSLPGPMLPVRSLLLTDYVPESIVNDLVEDTKNMSAIPPNMLEYLDSIEDRLEKALFLIALRTIYGNVIS